MKIAGVNPKELSTECILVLPRGETQIVFRAVGVPDGDEFKAMVPEPKAPVKMVAGGKTEPNEDDPGYRSIMRDYLSKHMNWLVLRSLEPSDIEWETVDMDKPETWGNWVQELLDNGFSTVEVNRIRGLAMEANCLDEDKLKQARDSFLRGQAEASKE